MVSSTARRNCSRKVEAPAKTDRKSGSPYSITDGSSSVRSLGGERQRLWLLSSASRSRRTALRSAASCRARLVGASLAASGSSSIRRSSTDGSRLCRGLAIGDSARGRSGGELDRAQLQDRLAVVADKEAAQAKTNGWAAFGAGEVGGETEAVGRGAPGRLVDRRQKHFAVRTIRHRQMGSRPQEVAAPLGFAHLDRKDASDRNPEILAGRRQHLQVPGAHVVEVAKIVERHAIGGAGHGGARGISLLEHRRSL